MAMYRRLCLQYLAMAGASALPLARAQKQGQAHNFGLVQPPLLPARTPLTLQDGQSAELLELLKGRVTALQLMFTGCSATCPIQGALFASAQQALSSAKLPRLQFLSLSIDPLNDGPQQLRAWLARFQTSSASTGGPRWLAGVATFAAMEALQAVLQGIATGGVDRHSAQVYFFNPQSRLVMRTPEFPSAETIAFLLKDLDHAS